MWEIIYYEKDNKEIPIYDFIESTEKEVKAKIFQKLILLEEYGNNLREPYSKHLRNGIFELRIKQDNNISRILYFFFIDKKIILTNGFIKKTQKAPIKEIEKAEKYKKDYERRFKK